MNALLSFADHGPAAQPVPEHDLPMNAVVELGPRGSNTLRVAKVVRRWPRRGSTASRVEFMDVDSGLPTFLDDVQIAFLCRDGQFRIVEGADGVVVLDRPTLIERTAAEEAKCVRCKAYVDACLVEPASRSRVLLVPRIAAVAAARREKAPGFTTVLGWMDTWKAQSPFIGDDCFIRARNVGNPGHRLKSDLVALAVDRGTLASFKMAKGTGADAMKAAKAWLAQNHPDAVVADEDWPDVRTFQYRRKALDAYVADGLTFGWGYAARKHTMRYARPRPELPLEEVECDHTTMDVLVVDEGKGVVFGRPDIIAFRDRATGACLGMSIGFDAPSYTSFLSGLRHALYPKDMDEYPTANPWFAHGRFKRLYVDNALHFIGHNIRRAASHLKFEVAEFLPGEPWLKGAQEKLLGLISREVHELPAATFSNTWERKLYQEVARKPMVTISQLRAFVTLWVCDEWNVTEHEGLGLLDTLKGVPRDLWNDKVEKVRLAMPPPSTDFVALAGDSDERCVTKKGVRWDNIRYLGPGLEALRTHPDHRDGREDDDRRGRKHHGTKYLVRRDPHDLGRIYLTNPYDPDRRIIEVPAIRADYAEGLTLHQHRVILRNADQKLVARRSQPETELLRTRDRLAAFTAKLMSQREYAGIQRRLASFLEDGRRRHERAVVRKPTISAALSAEVLDPLDSAPMLPPVTVSPDAPSLTPARSRLPGTEPDPFEAGPDGLPRRGDRGAPVAASLAKRRAARTAASAQDDWEPEVTEWGETASIVAPAVTGTGRAVDDAVTGGADERPTRSGPPSAAAPGAPKSEAPGAIDVEAPTVEGAPKAKATRTRRGRRPTATPASAAAPTKAHTEEAGRDEVAWDYAARRRAESEDDGWDD